MSNRKSLQILGENYIANKLKFQGFHVRQNVRCSQFEIDIVATNDNNKIIAEVRTVTRFVSIDSVFPIRKLLTLSRAHLLYFQEYSFLCYLVTVQQNKVITCTSYTLSELY